MTTNYLKNTLLVFSIFILTESTLSQERDIKELDFLTGQWEVREDNTENGWWEKATRIGKYTLDSTYIELESKAIDSNGKKRNYRWFIHYNKKEKQFEMVSMFSNWHKIQFDLLEWNAKELKLTIRNKPDSEEGFHERLGVLTFSKDYKSYVWKGENKYGDPNKPSIWKYIEKGKRIHK